MSISMQKEQSSNKRVNFTPSFPNKSDRGRDPQGKLNLNFDQSSVANVDYSLYETLNEPSDFKAIFDRPDTHLWINAMKEELEALAENDTWGLCNLPKNRKAIKNKWVFKMKRNSHGQIERYKTRLVIKGCSQKYGIDYNEVFAPVVRYSTVRFLMALAVKFNLEIDHMDVVTAFLQGDLQNEEIYMDQPLGFVTEENKVCRLKKALYGLKQSGRIWNKKVDTVLKEFGLVQSEIDPCVILFKEE